MSNDTPTIPDKKASATRLQLAIPITIVALLAVWLLMGVSKATQPDGMFRYDFDRFGSVPASEDGRVKPLDTVARNALLLISGKQELADDMLLPDEGDKPKPAVVWLAELISARPESRDRRVLRIDDPDVLAIIGKTTDDGKRFALSEFFEPQGEGEETAYFVVGRKAEEARKVRDDQRTQFHEHVIALQRKLGLVGELRAMVNPYVVPPVEEGQDWSPVMSVQMGKLLPAARDREPAETWLNMIRALMEDKPEVFNAELDKHLALVSGYAPTATKKAAFEQGFNRYKPFVKGTALYLLAGILGLAALLLRPVLPGAWFTSLWRSGLGVLVLVFAMHTLALIVRIWLQGRPPVTNLYSSAVFIGWGIVGGAIVLEKITKLGVANLAASCAGVGTLIVAHNLAKDGDTMGVMQAVLDSNFWLGTHVITITLGYSATFLAGFIALVYIILGMCTPLLDRKSSRAMAGMVYATICFALLFSFVGTVLGGIWADQSWGRFWGWDPKENGAILIVLMNAIILHARWGHLVKERGIMVLAIGGNIITAWSWFGTNLLGVGLHSYGFMDGAMFTLALFAASQMLIMAVALMVPTNMWWSFRKPKKPSEKKTSKGDGPVKGVAPAGG